MKKLKQMSGPYSIGFELSSTAHGFVATDPNGNVLYHGKQPVMGTRVFKEGQHAAEARMPRTSRRGIQRRRGREHEMERVFAPVISSIDPDFFIRRRMSYKLGKIRFESDPIGFSYSRLFHSFPTLAHLDVALMESDSAILPELFPSLISYDGGISYLPLRVIDTVEVAGENYNFFADDAPYVTSKDEPVNTWASFPVVRYGPEGEPGMNYTPSELTMDEYFNTCELFFEDTEEEKPNLDGKKLPPTYIHMQKVGQTKPKEWYSEYKNVYSKVEFLDDYKIKLRKLGYGASPSFDLKNYVFSDSAWYALLRDPEYFKQGRLTYIGETTPYNQSIVWPDNQYVRLVELFIDRNRTREKKYWFSAIEAGFVANGRYDQWVKYVWDGEPKICSPYDAN